MSHRGAIVLLMLFAASVFTSCVTANDDEPKVADIYLAKSIGIWEAGKDYGYFKVIVYRMGLEHAQDKVRVIMTKAEAEKQQVIDDIWLDTPGIKGFVNDISLKMINSSRMALALDIEMKAMDGVVLREVYLIEKDQKPKLIAPVKHIDIY